MTNDAEFAYRETEALTTDPVGMVVVLYEMLLKDLRRALSAIAVGDIEARAAAVRHSLLVLQQLQSTLDFQRGGVVAENLDRFYNFSRAKLLEAQIKVSPEIFEQQITFVSGIRDAWEEVRNQQLAAVGTTVNLPRAVLDGGSAGVEGEVLGQWSA